MSIGTVPTKGEYTDLKPFRYWCQKVLPLVYDDSLSYYELLAKVVTYLNQAMEDVETLNEDVTNLFAAYEELQGWVTDYFENGGIDADIDDAIDRMVESGAFGAIVNEKVAAQINAVVANQIGDVVGNQIGATVAGQIGSTVASQLPGVVNNQIGNAVDNWLNNNIPVDTSVLDKTLISTTEAPVSYQVKNQVEAMKSNYSFIDKFQRFPYPDDISTGRNDYVLIRYLTKSDGEDTYDGECFLDFYKKGNNLIVGIPADSQQDVKCIPNVIPITRNLIPPLDADVETMVDLPPISNIGYYDATALENYFVNLKSNDRIKISFDIDFTYTGTSNGLVNLNGWKLIKIYKSSGNIVSADLANITLTGSLSDKHIHGECQYTFSNIDKSLRGNPKAIEFGLAIVTGSVVNGEYDDGTYTWSGSSNYMPESHAYTMTISGEVLDTEVSNFQHDLSDAFVTRTLAIDRTVVGGKGWDYYNNFAEKTLSGYYACSFSCEENTEYKIQARNIGTNTTFAIGFIDEDNNVISSISDLPSNPDHYAIVRTPPNCVLVKFTTNNQSTPPVKIETTKYEIPVDNQILYVATNGQDVAYDGSKDKPFQTIQKAINSGISDTIVIASGRYSAGFTCENRKKLHLIGSIDGGTVIDYSTTITPSVGASGVQEASFSSVSTDAIYQVFVSNELPLYQDGNARAYTVNLWTYDGLTLMIPKATLEEVQATAGTWTYDGSKLYIHGTAQYYKLVPTYDDIAVHLTGIDELIIENISIKFAGYINCKIEDCNNASITRCDFSNSGRQHGLAIEDSNVAVSNCTAFRNCYDGFNIHDNGNTTFTDCESGYNRDDGMSHHDGSIGTVIGGKYHHNAKGGISPTYDSKVNIYNALCASNGYGIYYSTVTNPVECTINNCVLLGNTAYGLRVVGYNINSFGTIYSDNNANKKADGDGTIYEILS